ncbi:phage/plasmid replication domain-containing protein [Phocaeicola sartorii]|uniref:phage/plasmid replication domain-containing protein n=1 Tax=Phocaeicola sartorii TaxID=671267 RepID=UPI0035144589
MYDTINFYHHDKALDLSSLNQHLEKVKRITDEETGEWLYSWVKIGDFKFQFGMNWLSATGSLPRLIYPDNTFMLSREEVQKCIETLSDKLHFDMNNVNVTRIDVAATFSMKHPVKLYLDCLGELQSFKKCLSVEDETLYYMQENEKYLQKLIFYDKLCQSLKRYKVHPKGVKGVNLLRYEREWHKVLPAQLKEPEVKGRTLYDERFYHKIVELWAESYFAIAKRKTLVDDAIGMIRTPKEGFYYIIAKALQILPIDFVTKHITIMQEYGVYSSPNSYSRLRAMFREIQSQANIMQETELMRELNEKITRVLNNLKP